MPSFVSSSRQRLLAGLIISLSALVLGGCGTAEPDVRFTAVAEPASPAEPADRFARPTVPRGAGRFDAADGAFTLWVAPTWRVPDAGPGRAEAIWHTGLGSSDFEPNVNVLVERLPRELSIDEYLTLSVDNGPQLVEGFRVIDASRVMLASGEIGGRFEYEGEFDGVGFKFLALISLDQTKAAIATYTNLAADYGAAVGDVEGYLLTLIANQDAAAPDAAEQQPEQKTKKQKNQKKKRKKAKRPKPPSEAAN